MASNWNTEWREMRRMVDTHSRPQTIITQLQMMIDNFPEFTEPCPTCKVEVGPCLTKSGRETETHSMRLTRAARALEAS